MQAFENGVAAGLELINTSFEVHAVAFLTKVSGSIHHTPAAST